MRKFLVLQRKQIGMQLILLSYYLGVLLSFIFTSFQNSYSFWLLPCHRKSEEETLYQRCVCAWWFSLFYSPGILCYLKILHQQQITHFVKRFISIDKLKQPNYWIRYAQKANVVNKINIHFSFSCSFSSRKLMWSTLANSHKVERYYARTHVCVCVLTSHGDTFMLYVACIIYKAKCVCMYLYLYMHEWGPLNQLVVCQFQTVCCIVYILCMKKQTVCHTHWCGAVGPKQHIIICVCVPTMYMLVSVYQWCVASFRHNWIIIITLDIFQRFHITKHTHTHTCMHIAYTR